MLLSEKASSMSLSRVCHYIFSGLQIVDHIGDYTAHTFYSPKCCIATPVDFFPRHSCITALHQIIDYLNQEQKQQVMKWLKGPPWEFLFSPRALERKPTVEWYETYISSFTKQKPTKLLFKKRGLFDEIPRRQMRKCKHHRLRQFN